MNVYITGMPGVSASTINDTIRFLNKSQGRLTFIKSEGISEKQLCRVLKTENSIESFDFCQLEDISDVYRTLREIEDADLVVFLSDYKLDYEKFDGDKRWFSYFSNNNIVVKTYGWEGYTSNRPYLAISHQIAENIFQIKSGLSLKTGAPTNLYHFDTSQVCINNFVMKENDIKIKLYSGYICQECSEMFFENNSSFELYNQLNNIIEVVRADLKPKFEAKNQIENIEFFEDGRILIGNDRHFKFPQKYLEYLYLFFLVNNGKQFTKQNIFSNELYLESLFKCYNIMNKKSYEKPDLKDMPKVIKTLYNNRTSTKSTLNTYRAQINKFIPSPYNLNTITNGNITYRYGIDLPSEKVKLPDKFLGFRCND